MKLHGQSLENGVAGSTLLKTGVVSMLTTGVDGRHLAKGSHAVAQGSIETPESFVPVTDSVKGHIWATGVDVAIESAVDSNQVDESLKLRLWSSNVANESPIEIQGSAIPVENFESLDINLRSDKLSARRGLKSRTKRNLERARKRAEEACAEKTKTPEEFEQCVEDEMKPRYTLYIVGAVIGVCASCCKLIKKCLANSRRPNQGLQNHRNNNLEPGNIAIVVA